MEVVHDLIPADGVHISIETRAQLELIALEGQPLPLGQRVDYLTIGSHVRDVKCDRALHTVQVIIEAGGAIYKQRGGDPVQIQPHRQVMLKVGVNQLNSALELIVGQGHLIAGGNGQFAHVHTVLYVRFWWSQPSSFFIPKRSRRRVSSLPRIWQSSTAPPGVTSLPATAMRTGHISVAFFTPNRSARAISVSCTAS